MRSSAAFIWLNMPEASDLAYSLQMPTTHLAQLDLVFRKVGHRSVELSLLRRLLQMNALEWSRATLDWNTFADQTYPDMRFCPKCLERAYHTAIFQLRSITICPEHRCELMRGCPGCGTALPTVLSSGLLHSSFTCLRCGRFLARSEILIDPPTLGALPGIARIADWYRWTAEMPRIETLPLQKKEDGTEVVYSQLWALLELAGGKRAPELVNLEREKIAGAGARVVACGLRLKQSGRLPPEDRPAEPFAKQMRSLALYRRYRRQLNKRMPRSERKLLRDFLRLFANPWEDSVTIPSTEDSRESRAIAFALLLFRFTMEGWSSLSWGISPHTANSIVDGCNCFAALYETRCLVAHRPNSFHCSPVEEQWLQDHLVFEGLRSLFEDAVCHAREMVRTGYYFLVNLSHFQKVYFPYCLGKRDGKGRLELWSLRLATDLSDYRRVQEIWMSPPTARILYKESRAGV